MIMCTATACTAGTAHNVTPHHTTQACVQFMIMQPLNWPFWCVSAATKYTSYSSVWRELADECSESAALCCSYHVLDRPGRV